MCGKLTNDNICLLFVLIFVLSMQGIAKQLQRSERDRKDERELRPDFVTRADLDGFRYL